MMSEKKQSSFFFPAHWTQLNRADVNKFLKKKCNLFTRVALIRQSVKMHGGREGVCVNAIWFRWAQHYCTRTPHFSRDPRKASSLQKAEGTSLALGSLPCLNVISPLTSFKRLSGTVRALPPILIYCSYRNGGNYKFLCLCAQSCNHSRNLIPTIKPSKLKT